MNQNPLVNKVLYVFITASALLLASCGGDPDAALRRQIRQLTKDGAIDAADCEAIRATVAASPELAAWSSDEAIRGLVVKLTKNEAFPIECPAVQGIDNSGTAGDNTNSGKLTYNIYVENSGSIYGYLKSNTKFKECLYDLLTRFNGQGDKCDVKIINDKVFDLDKLAGVPQKAGISQRLDAFTQFLTEPKLKTLGDVSSSHLNDIFEIVKDSLLKTGEPVVLVSDYIYSIPTLSNMEDELAEATYTTKAIFQSLRSGYGALVIKGSSEFDGKYYTYENKPLPISENRPFYLWVIGRNADIKDFAKKYNIHNLPGYENHYAIFNEGGTGRPPYYSVLMHTAKKGSFQPNKAGASSIEAIKDASMDARKGGFGLSVAVDLSQLRVTDDYLTDPNNFAVKSSIGDEFRVIAIEKIDKTAKNDRRYCGSATHFITLETSKLNNDEQKLEISVLNQIPAWIEQSSVLDDRSKEKRINRTFGFEHLVKGVFQGIFGETDKPSFYTFVITLNND